MEQALNDLNKAVAERQNAAKAILEDASMTALIVALTDAEKLLFNASTAAREKVRDALPEFPTVDNVQAAATARDKEVKPKLEELNKEINARKGRQEEGRKLRSHGDMTRKITANATVEETQVVTAAREALLKCASDGGAPTVKDIEERSWSLMSYHLPSWRWSPMLRHSPESSDRTPLGPSGVHADDGHDAFFVNNPAERMQPRRRAV